MQPWTRRALTLYLALLALNAQHAIGQTKDVAFAGVAFSGDAATLEQRFPYSRQYEKLALQSGESLYKRAMSAIAQKPPKNFTISTNQIDELKGQDQVIVTSLVLNSETVSIERFGEVRKLFALLKGQALFFDFKSMTVIRAYPVSFGYIDNFNRDPSPQEVLERVKLVFEGSGDKPGLITRFASSLESAMLPAQTPRLLQVSNVTLAPELINALPAYLKTSPGVSETWAADLIGEALSTRVGVPIIPYTKGYAIGNVMSMKVSDGEVYNLTLPKPDYEINVDFKGVKKVQYSQSGAGASFIYGSYADIRILEPLSGKTYLNTALKNGEVKVVPKSQTYVDDFPAYYDSLNGMFVKLAEAIAGRGNDWIKVAAAAPDIAGQITQTTELMNLCK